MGVNPYSRIKTFFMKRFKFFLLTFSFLLSVTLVLATHEKQFCTGFAQYYWNGTTYVYAGTPGKNFYCSGTTGTCTYYLVGSTYTFCEAGTFEPLGLKDKKSK